MWRAAGRWFRPAHHGRASELVVGVLRGLEARTVVDLRRAGERQCQPTRWLDALTPALISIVEPNSQAAYAALPPHIAALSGGDGNAQSVARFLARLYGDIPYDPVHVDLFRRYFAALSQTGAGVLIHCSAGKDRTGILAALTLSLLDVDQSDIMADFLLTNTASNIAERLPKLGARLGAAYSVPIEVAALLTLMQVEPACLETMFDTLRARSGTMAQYLSTVIGVDPSELDRIAARLVG